MLKWVLGLVGTLVILNCGLGLALKVFGTDDMVVAYANSSRNLDISIIGLMAGLALLGLSAILKRLDRLLVRMPLDEDQ